MPSAEIITIGTEILLGDILDTNTQYIARKLRNLGINLFRMSSVGDNIQRIAQEIEHALQRCDIVLTTGGLGPTVDDPTRQAVALAVGSEIEFHPELWEQIQERFSRFNQNPTENNKRQAYLPHGAEAIENPVGTAPAFHYKINEKVIICLPGVPREMEYLFDHAVSPFLIRQYQLKGIIKSLILHTVGIGESRIDELIGDLEVLNNPTVGLSAHSGQVDIRITAKADSSAEADILIEGVEHDIRDRIGEWVYGMNEETLEEIILEKLKSRGWTLSVVEFGLNGHLIGKFSQPDLQQRPDFADIFRGGTEITGIQQVSQLLPYVEAERTARASDCCLGVALQAGEHKQSFEIVLITPAGVEFSSRAYGGPPEYGPRYALHYGLAMILNI